MVDSHKTTLDNLRDSIDDLRLSNRDDHRIFFTAIQNLQLVLAQQRNVTEADCATRHEALGATIVPLTGDYQTRQQHGEKRDRLKLAVLAALTSAGLGMIMTIVNLALAMTRP